MQSQRRHRPKYVSSTFSYRSCSSLCCPCAYAGSRSMYHMRAAKYCCAAARYLRSSLLLHVGSWGCCPGTAPGFPASVLWCCCLESCPRRRRREAPVLSMHWSWVGSNHDTGSVCSRLAGVEGTRCMARCGRHVRSRCDKVCSAGVGVAGIDALLHKDCKWCMTDACVCVVCLLLICSVQNMGCGKTPCGKPHNNVPTNNKYLIQARARIAQQLQHGCTERPLALHRQHHISGMGPHRLPLQPQSGAEYTNILCKQCPCIQPCTAVLVQDKQAQDVVVGARWCMDMQRSGGGEEWM